MRARLFSAVRALLTDLRVAGQQDAVRLAAVVLLAKSPANSTRVPTRTGELARWMGCSASHVGHTVLPALKDSGIATSEIISDDAGQVTGLELHLEPLREARDTGGDHPLMLTRRDLATLLRLCEAVIGPGWAPKDGPVTPAGLLAERRGRGAATDRLALLLLVLQTRADGRVRMVGGSVAAGRGRADATVARALGCSVSGGAKVVDRLESCGLVEVTRGATASGCFGRGRLRVPAVSDAHGRVAPLYTEEQGADDPAAPGQPSPACERCAEDDPADDPAACGDGWVQGSFDEVVEESSGERPAAACGDLDGSAAAESLGASGTCGAEGDCGANVGERPVGAELHAPHPQMVEVSRFSAGELDGCSGSAVEGWGPLPERASAGEDQPGCKAGGESSAAEGEGGPLRGEQPNSPALDSFGRPSAARRAVFTRPSSVPEDLAQVLAPVAGLWAGLGRTSTCRWLAGAVRTELARLRGLVGDELAEQVLAERLERRLLMQGGRPVVELQGWLMSRGLPQRPGCWSHLCDDGVRMDTGGGCASCDSLLGDRRALRRSVAADVAEELPQLPAEVRRGEAERRLHQQVQLQAAADLARRERTVVEQAARQEAVARRREALDAAERQRAAAACEECGIPEAAGLCLVCSSGRRAGDLLREAVDVTVALRADLDDPASVEAFAGRVEEDTRTLLADACARSGASEAAELAFTRRTVAERILAGRRTSALKRLAGSEAAEDEAERAYAAGMRRQHRYATRTMALRAAEKAADKARTAAAQALLQELLARLAQQRATSPPERPDWSRRCAELAQRPLADDTAAAGTGMPIGTGLVSAA
jgi:hypothetical protein